MKKLLMLGAILILGTVGYGAQRADIIQNGSEEYIADTTLTLRTKGNVVDTANNAVLVITPMNGTGASGDRLMFHFGSIAPGESATLKGKFKAEVLKYDANTLKTGELKEGDRGNIKVGLLVKGTGNQDITSAKPSITARPVNERGTTNKIGSISYTLSNNSGVRNSGKVYEGEIISTFTADGDAKGNFTDTGVMVVVNVTDVEIK